MSFPPGFPIIYYLFPAGLRSVGNDRKEEGVSGIANKIKKEYVFSTDIFQNEFFILQLAVG